MNFGTWARTGRRTLVVVAAAATLVTGAGMATASATPVQVGPISATPADSIKPWLPSSPLPSNFTLRTDRPSLDDLNKVVYFLVATGASDQAKAANVEGGMSSVIVPRTVYTLGLFRAPLGWNRVTGPLVQNGDHVTATLNSGSAGRPTIRMTIAFKRINGNWALASSSMCEGVKTVGLRIYCNS